MRPRASPGVLAAGCLLALACAHAPRRAELPPPDVTYPAPPAAPRARLERLLSGGGAPAAGASRWRRVLDTIVGLERAAPEERLRRPFGVLAGEAGELLVADPDLGRVVRARGAALDPVTCPERAWSAPMALAREPSGALLVADAGAGLVVRVDAGGRCASLGAGQLERPTGLAATAERIYVADPPRHEVVVLSPEGRVVARFGGRGEGDGQLSFPTSVAVAPDGSLLVVDALNFRISRFSPEGRPLGAFGAPGDEGGELARPKAIAADAAGRIYVSDAQRDAVLVYSAGGAFEYAIGTTGGDPGQLAHPAGIAVDGDRLLVADSLNGRVQVFTLLGVAP